MSAAKTRRLQVLIEESQWARLEELAKARGVSVASLVRGAIETALPGGSQGRAAAARAVLEGTPMPVPDPPELRQELDELPARRA